MTAFGQRQTVCLVQRWANEVAVDDATGKRRSGDCQIAIIDRFRYAQSV